LRFETSLVIVSFVIFLYFRQFSFPFILGIVVTYYFAQQIGTILIHIHLRENFI